MNPTLFWKSDPICRVRQVHRLQYIHQHYTGYPDYRKLENFEFLIFVLVKFLTFLEMVYMKEFHCYFAKHSKIQIHRSSVRKLKNKSFSIRFSRLLGHHVCTLFRKHRNKVLQNVSVGGKSEKWWAIVATNIKIELIFVCRFGELLMNCRRITPTYETILSSIVYLCASRTNHLDPIWQVQTKSALVGH